MSTSPLQNSPTIPFDVASGLAATTGKAAWERRIAEVREELKEWGGNSESQLESVSEQALTEALTIAREMFACEPSIRLMVDPAEPGFPYYVINVCFDSRLTAREFMSLELAWFEKVRHLFSGPFNYPRLMGIVEPHDSH